MPKFSGTITCLRHSKADKTVSADHRLHPLSNEGVEIADARRIKLAEPIYDLVLSSKLIRAAQTAMFVAGLASTAEVVEVPDLFFEDDSAHGKDINIMFGELAYASPAEYMQHELSEALTTNAQLAKSGIMAAIDAANLPAGASVLVVGHSIITNVLGMVFDSSSADMLMNVSLGETHGFVVEITDTTKVTELIND
jgi:broad specificity phosphatase PhoE